MNSKLINFIKEGLTQKNLILLLTFFILFLSLRWNSFSTPFERDEGEYAYSAWILRQGIMPYENSFIQKPPMIIYTYLLGQFISSDAIWPPRLLSAIFILGTTVLVFLIAKKEFGSKAAWISAFIFNVIVASPINASLAANTEVFMLLPLCGLLYLYIYKKNTTFSWVLSGVLASLALLYKPISAYIILFIFVVWFVEIIKIKNKRNRYFMPAYVFLGGGLTTFLVLLPFLLHDGGKAFWESTVVFDSLYAKHWGYNLGYFFGVIRTQMKSFWLVYLMVVGFFLTKTKKRLFYLGIIFFGLAAIYQTNIRHYYILLMPFLALIVSAVVIEFSKVKFIKKYLKEKSYVVITMGLVITIIWPVKEQFSKSPQDLSLWVYGYGNPFYEAPLVAQKLKEATKPDDYVFIAGSEPEILFYAKRLSSSKFVITYPLIIETALREEYQKQAVQELKDKPPSAIVYTTREESGLWNEDSPRIFIDYLDNLIDINYRLVGGYLWGRRGGYWVSPLPEEEKVNSSLLLYARI